MAGLTHRPLDEADVPALAATAGAPHDLRSQLFDLARGGGQNVRVASRGDEVCGCVGWVDAPPWCYAAPFLARDAEAAALLLDVVIAHAREIGAAAIRTGADADERAKRDALAAAGFTVALDFIDHARRVERGAIPALPWRRVPHDALDAALLCAVSNDTFAQVANAPPMTVEMVREQLQSEMTSREATAAWTDGDRYVAFVHVTAGNGYATIESVGVRGAMQRKGAASLILDDVMARLPEGLEELRARIASTNPPSLALHARKGFREVGRRTVFERGVLPE
jgi:ribosomal protein S18 acetylase RimI-like enzyme